MARSRSRFLKRATGRRQESGRGYILAVAVIEGVLAVMVLYLYGNTLTARDPWLPPLAPEALSATRTLLLIALSVEVVLAAGFLGLWFLAKRWPLPALIITLSANSMMLLLRVVFMRGVSLGCWLLIANIIIISGLIGGICSNLASRRRALRAEAESAEAQPETGPEPDGRKGARN